AIWVDRDSHAPFLLVLAGTCITLARLDKSFEVGTIEVRAHDSHAFAITPVELPVLFIELELLRSMRAARRHNVFEVASVEVRAFDRTIVGLRIAHIGPVDVTGLYVNDDPVRKSSALTDDYFQIGAVGVRGEHAAAAYIQEEQAAFRRGIGFRDSC